MGDPNTRAAVNALPVYAANWFLMVAPTLVVSAVVDIRCIAEYDVEFFGRLPLTDNTYLARQVALSNPKLVEKRKIPDEDPLTSEGKLLLSEGKYGSMDGLIDDDNELVESKAAFVPNHGMRQLTAGSGGLSAARFWGSSAKTPLGANKG